jgi:SRSO17 transposase
VDNGIVTVHVGVAKGRFQALLDAELYLPKSWGQDRQRCKEAGIPDCVGYRPKWRIAFDQLLRLDQSGVKFDWLTFDEGYGSKVPFLTLLSLAGQRFVAEVPVSFAVHVEGIEGSVRADEILTGSDARRGRRHRVRQETRADAWWRADSLGVRVRGRDYTLVVAVNEATAEVKYFLSNAAEEPLGRLLQVAFRRATIEHGFRLAKTEAGLTHYEGRLYVGLCRHLTLALIVLGFVSAHTDRLRGEKPSGDAGAGVPGVERAMRGPAPSAARDGGDPPHRRGDPLPPTTQRRGHPLPQEAAA